MSHTVTEELTECLWSYVRAQGRMRDRWAEGDEAVKKELWVSLHACEDKARNILESFALQPPPTAEQGEASPPPCLHKPFIAANVREVMDKMNDDISYSRGVELLNEIAAKYYSTAEQGEGNELLKK